MKIGKGWLGLVASVALVLATIGTAVAQSDTLASVKQKGNLAVGVKADYKPFGYTDPSGRSSASRSISRTTSRSAWVSRSSSCLSSQRTGWNS